ncbi:LANO_0C03312g1_1 [Lachancea nothofagi CBS 11611]|uniref:LANO_0C03312g1_1 n=1 Tax=Lachancea nothofagi CBS 11611 TaxID=1266666 RepID=A0A1G4J5I3_9SACH|nr:LANO_0C03312g1_1 [Lachancea nothofagi CBS 11611]
MREESKPLLSKHAMQRASTYDSSLSENAVGSSSNPEANLREGQSPLASRSSMEIVDRQKEYQPLPSTFVGHQPNPTFWHHLTYYLPCFSWLPSYNSSKLMRDLIAGASLASFQIPLAMSYSTSIAHVPPMCGLNALAITPFVYAVFGSVPQMIVGPESAISLVVGQAIEKISKHDNSISVTDLCVVLTFSSGMILFLFGLMRFGFLDSVLSRSLLRGFISAVGLVMVLNSLISELKLKKVFEDAPDHYHAPFEKVKFLLKYAPENYDLPTAILSGVTFCVLMILKQLKKRLSKRFRRAVFFPEILVVVTMVTLLSFFLGFKQKYNIEIVGDIKAESSSKFKNPFAKKSLPYYNDLFHASFMIALLGFFESTTASKSLGTSYDLAISSNRELIALGSLNLVGSLLGALPSFGGYGRSKINAYTGAATVMSGVFMGGITFITSKFLLSMIHYIPICILSVITTVVGITLFEEAPADLKFHFRCSGYNELITYTITVLTTFFYSVEAGITVGCGYSIIRAIKNSTRSRIQILARITGTNRFVNADEFDTSLNQETLSLPRLEHFEGCLIVKIPEPLTFTNTEDLKSRLNRLESYGSVNTHPASPRSRDKDLTKHMIFDLNGMTQIDSSASQILCEIVTNLRKRRVKVYFTRIPLTATVRNRLEASGIVGMVEKMTVNDPMALTEVPTPSWCFNSIQDALRATDEADSDTLSEAVSECTSLSGTFVRSSAV